MEHAAAMVREQIAARGVKDEAVLAAMRAVPRDAFVDAEVSTAFGDHPVQIGHGQTISQPYIVAKMTELAQIERGMRVLEIGTGSGYQAAVLAQMGATVFSVEIVPALAERATQALRGRDVHVRLGDGAEGWPEEAPFDAILLTAAPPEVPPALLEQLRVGGRLVAPVGESGPGSTHQELVVMHKTRAGIATEQVCGVRFVPMTGRAQERAT